MRAALAVLVFLVAAFAGCLGGGGDGETPTDTGDGPDDHDDGNLTQKPDKRFEPELKVTAKDVFLDKGDTVHLDYDITDLQDYEYPVTFIDWNVMYEGEPNPVDEGDASQLPGSYERQLFRDGHHNFTFFVDDGQGFKENRTVHVWVGPVPVDETAADVDEGPTGGPEPTQVETYFEDACLECDGNSNVERPGSAVGIPDVNVYFFALDPAFAGSPYQLLSTGFEPRAEFLDTCDGTAVGDFHIGDEGVLDGTIPDGATCVAIWEGIHGVIGPLGPYSQGIQGGKFTLGLNQEAVFDDEGLCWTNDFVLVGHNEAGAGIYQTDFGWVYEEGNGIPGLQWSADQGHKAGCEGGDIVIF